MMRRLFPPHRDGGYLVAVRPVPISVVVRCVLRCLVHLVSQCCHLVIVSLFTRGRLGAVSPCDLSFGLVCRLGVQHPWFPLGSGCCWCLCFLYV